MKSKSKNLTTLLLLVVITTVELIAYDAIASRNGPNYWGDAYPGQGQTPNYFRNPQRREDYVFLGDPDPSAQWYDGSHYGTHDWIADAALRSLKSVVHNPAGWRNWDWLLDNFLVIRDDHIWNPDYGTNEKHNSVRSYMTFLFATQMPDMKKKEYPEVQQINIPEEATVIKDVATKPVRLGLWVGQVQQHKYTFIEVENEDGRYEFRPDLTFAADKVELLGKEAIKSISNKKKDDDGKEVSAMQPEASAGWLGAMAHYYGDLINPAHIHELYLFQEPNRKLYVEDKYHKWIENHLAALTMWDRGPETTVFKFDFSLIDNQIITPISPKIAAIELAEKTIRTAFRVDGNNQYVYGDSFSGMYIDDADLFWNWEDDISFVGRDRSQHKAFYAKVERLLCWAVYYTACAMQYCYDEGKKKNDDDDPNHNYYVDNPPRDDPPSNRPVPDAGNERDSLESQNSNDRKLARIARNFRNLGENLTTWALLGIARIIEETVKVISR